MADWTSVAWLGLIFGPYVLIIAMGLFGGARDVFFDVRAYGWRYAMRSASTPILRNLAGLGIASATLGAIIVATEILRLSWFDGYDLPFWSWVVLVGFVVGWPLWMWSGKELGLLKSSRPQFTKAFEQRYREWQEKIDRHPDIALDFIRRHNITDRATFGEVLTALAYLDAGKERKLKTTLPSETIDELRELLRGPSVS